MELKNNTIIVIMFGLLGDVLIRTTVLRALKELYPEAQITAVVDPIGQAVLSNNPDCEDIIIVDRNKKNRLTYYMEKIKSIFKVRAKQADLIVDLYNGGSSPFLVFLSSAKYRLGYAHQKDKSMYNLQSSYIPYKFGIESFNKQVLSILEPLSQKEFSLKPSFNYSPKIEEKVAKYINTLEIKREKTYLVNLGSGGEEKLLDNAVYFQMIEYIYKTYDFTPVIIQNPGQEYLQENLINEYLINSTIPYTRLKKLSLGEVGVFMKQCQFLLTPDTGLMHLALALDSYILAFFTYTNPKLVEIGSEKFVALYEKFDDEILYQDQKICSDNIYRSIDKIISIL